jgi:hypothetical protein
MDVIPLLRKREYQNLSKELQLLLKKYLLDSYKKIKNDRNMIIFYIFNIKFTLKNMKTLVRKGVRILTTLLLTTLIFNSCSGDDDITISTTNATDYDSTVVSDWYGLIKTLTTETAGYTPPVAARAFGYTGITLYEAVHHGIPGKSSLSGKLVELNISVTYNETQEYYWPLVASTALANMTKYFYSNTSSERYTAILNLENQCRNLARAAVSDDVYVRSINLAMETVEQMILYSLNDGGHNGQYNNFPSDYNLPMGASFWKPTAPGFLPALQPYWGANRPFLAQNINNTQPIAPPAYSTDVNSIFHQRAMEVYNVVNNITPEQIKIAEYWSDDPVTTATPPGHSISVLNQLLIENNTNLGFGAEAFAKLGIGISDAFISCWKTKYDTNYPRPITYITEQVDPNWNTILPTPPFPEYTSGHSVQSGALAEISTELFGANYFFTDHTHEDRTDIDGTPRNYSDFYNMAEEAALSRLYGGIHFKEAIELGLEQGYQIGRNINALNLNE